MVRLTDRLDMTIAVYLEVKQQTKPNNKLSVLTPYIFSFENSLKPDKYSIENKEDLDQLFIVQHVNGDFPSFLKLGPGAC